MSPMAADSITDASLPETDVLILIGSRIAGVVSDARDAVMPRHTFAARVLLKVSAGAAPETAPKSK